MSTRDENLYRLCQQTIDGKLSIREFSILIKKSYRQCQRIVNKVTKLGMLGIKHGNYNKVPHNKTSMVVLEDIRSLLKNDYSDFNLTHFREMLIENEGIKVGKNIIHRIARLHGLVKKTKRRSSKRIHKPRARLPNEGMLVQFDGSVHGWFGDTVCDLIGGLDDATGKILGLEFFHGETSLHCMKVMRDITIKFGVPTMYYLDGAGYFGKIDRDVDTQIGRALEQIGSKVSIASSSQAKGKIERLWGTLQDRLVAELRYYQITTMAGANEFLQNFFIPKFNKQFSVTPRERESHFKKPLIDNLNLVFCKKEPRKVMPGNNFSYGAELYVLTSTADYRFRTININTLLSGEIIYDICGRTVTVKKASENRIDLLNLPKKAA